MFIASCASPRCHRAVARPGHRHARLLRILNASAAPTATGISAGRWLTIAIRPSRMSAMCTLPSLPARQAVGAAHVLGEDPPRLGAAGHVHAHVALDRRAHVVACIAVATPTAGALVAAAGVEAAGDLALAVEDVPALLDPARDQHVAVDLEEVLAVEVGLLDVLGRLDRRGFSGDCHPLLEVSGAGCRTASSPRSRQRVRESRTWGMADRNRELGDCCGFCLRCGWGRRFMAGAGGDLPVDLSRLRRRDRHRVLRAAAPRSCR